MRPVARAAAPEHHLLFLPSVFNETLELLFDAHQYFNEHGNDDQAVLSPMSRDMYAGEMSRITMRLTSVMAWIMVRRAVTAGRIEENKAAHSYRLEAGEICLMEPCGIDELPGALGYLSERSQDLYKRVWRLDEQAYGTRQ